MSIVNRGLRGYIAAAWFCLHYPKAFSYPDIHAVLEFVKMVESLLQRANALETLLNNKLLHNASL